MACLDENQALGLASGTLEGELREQALAHVDGCEACRKLLAFCALGLSGAPDPVPAPAAPKADAASPTLAPGTAVGRYIVREHVGEGAMGVVYIADDPKLNRRIAIKMLRPQAQSNRPDAT